MEISLLADVKSHNFVFAL